MKTSIPELPSFHISPSQLTHIAVDLINGIQTATKQLLDKLTPQDATFENVILSMAQIDNYIKSKVQFLTFFQAVSPSFELRQESSVAVSIVDTAYLELFQDENLFALVDAVHKNYDGSQMEIEDQKYFTKLHSTFIDNGLGLNEKNKKRSQEISKRLVELRVAFTENLSLDPGCVWKEEEHLEGLGAERIQALPLHPSNGQRGVPLKKTYVNAVLSSCVRSETRKEVFLQSQRRFPENIELFKEIVILRDERARLLGFKSYAHQQARSKLLKSPQDVKTMLDELSMHLLPVAQKELEALQRTKDPSGSPFYLWDFDYHHDKMLRDNYQVDHDLIAEYFPAKVTIQRMLSVFETIFSLKIENLKCIRGDHVWDPDVKVFSVLDRDSSTFLGFLYLDIYPRDGKFNHAANFNIFPVCAVPLTTQWFHLLANTCFQ
jgi:metallopeptidase MepB